MLCAGVHSRSAENIRYHCLKHRGLHVFRTSIAFISTQSSVTFDFSYLFSELTSKAPNCKHSNRNSERHTHTERKRERGRRKEAHCVPNAAKAKYQLCIKLNGRYNLMISIVMLLVNGVSISHNKICQLCSCFIALPPTQYTEYLIDISWILVSFLCAHFLRSLYFSFCSSFSLFAFLSIHHHPELVAFGFVFDR